MRVELRRYATLAPATVGRLAGEPEQVEVADGATVADLVASLGLTPQDVHLVLVDGRIRHDRDARLSAGARVALFPPVGGG